MSGSAAVSVMSESIWGLDERDEADLAVLRPVRREDAHAGRPRHLALDLRLGDVDLRDVGGGIHPVALQDV